MKAQVNGIEIDCNCSKYLDSRGSRVSKDWTNECMHSFLNVSQMYNFYRHQNCLVKSILRGYYMYTERNETFGGSII